MRHAPGTRSVLDRAPVQSVLVGPKHLVWVRQLDAAP